jgi:hypothetical protein
MKKQARISRITVGRLYNLGNYENVRYDLTVEIPEGQSAVTAIVGLEKIIAGMAPIRGVKSEAEIGNDAFRVEAMKKLTTDDWNRQFGHCKGYREEVTARYEKDCKADKLKRNKAIKLAAKARALFNSLGGAAQWKDAKLNWQDGDY